MFQPRHVLTSLEESWNPSNGNSQSNKQCLCTYLVLCSHSSPPTCLLTHLRTPQSDPSSSERFVVFVWLCVCASCVWMFAKCVWVKKLYFALMWYIFTSVFTCHSDKYKHTSTTGINITLIFRATFWPLCNSHPHGNLAGVLFSRPYTLSHTELKNKLCVSTYHGRIFLLAVLTVNYFSTACGLLNILPIQ